MSALARVRSYVPTSRTVTAVWWLFGILLGLGTAALLVVVLMQAGNIAEAERRDVSRDATVTDLRADVTAQAGALKDANEALVAAGETPVSVPNPKATAGPTGASGPRGAAGATGAAGSTGATGAQGLRGPRGFIGPVSTVAGPAGPAGATGAKGDRGAQGVDGRDGADGVNGTDGLNGTDGADSTVPGPAGPAGAACPDGSHVEQRSVITAAAPLGEPALLCIPD